MKKALLKLFTFSLGMLVFTQFVAAQEFYRGEWYYPPANDFDVNSSIDYQNIEEEHFVHFQPSTGDIKNIYSEGNERFAGSNGKVLPLHKGLEKQLKENSLTKNFGLLSFAPDNTTYPQSAAVKLFVKFQNRNVVFSGAMTGIKTVLTAGRCVYDQDLGWAREIRVVPGYSNGDAPFGEGIMIDMYALDGWVNDGDPQADIGIINLDRVLGLYSDTMGYLFSPANDVAPIMNGQYKSHGYPAEFLYSGQQQYTREGTFDDFDQNIISFNRRSFTGEQGTGFYDVAGDGNTFFIGGVLSNWTESPELTNCVGFTETRLDIIFEVTEDAFDRDDLLASNMFAESAEVPAGEAVSEASFLALNFSDTDFRGNLDIKYYLSTDDNITADDLFLLDQRVNTTIDFFERIEVGEGDLVIPSDVVPGDYFIGAIIQNVDDYIPNNASIGLDAFPITITEGANTVVLEVDPQVINVPAPAGTTSANIQTNVEWTPSTEATWLSFGTNTDNSVEILYEENTATTGRSAEVIITGGSETRTIIVNQEAAANMITAAPQVLNYEAVGGELSLTINANTSWSLSSPAAWLSYSVTLGDGTQTITVTAAENPSTQGRSTTITISGTGVSETVQVNQEGQEAFLNGAPEVLNYAAIGGDQDANITANIAYSISTSADWLTLTDAAGTGDLTLGVTAAPNPSTEPRSTVITIAGGGMTEFIQVNQEGADEMLTVSPTNLTYDAPGGSQNVNVTANVSYDINTLADWLTITPTNGNGDQTISVTAEENTSTESRSTTITITGEDGTTQTIVVTQAGAAVIFAAAPEVLNYEAPGGNQDANITANIGYTLSTEADWVTLSVTSGNGNQTFTVTAAENTSTESRSTTIIVIGEDGTTQTIIVNQAGAAVILTAAPEALNYDAIGGDQDANITANISYTLSTEADWLMLSVTSGNGNQTFTVTAAENTSTEPRSTTIVVMGEDGSTQTITVSQNGAGVIFAVAPEALNYDAIGGDQDVNITANISYTLSTEADWLTLSVTSGNGNQTFTVTAAENTSTEPRSTTIVVMGEDGSTQTITVSQNGAGVIFAAAPEALNYDAVGGNQNASVTANISYTLSTEADWLTLSIASGNGDQTFIVTAAENTSTEPRSTTIVVTGEDGSTQTITVNQQGVDAFITAAPDMLNYTAIGGDQNTVINSNISYTISTEADWLTLSEVSGSGMLTLVVTAAENTVTMARSATIIVTGEDGSTQTIVVNQAAAEERILAASPNNLLYEALGGDQTVNITANVNYTITTEADWLTLDATGGEGNQALQVTAAENTATTARSTTIEISGEGLSQTITVTQAAASFLMAAPNELNYDAPGGDQEVEITGNVSYSIVTEANWLTLSSAGGEGNQTLTVTAAENTATAGRSATIIVSGNGLTQTIQVNQLGVEPALVVSPTNLTFDAPGGDQNAMITANVSYSITTEADWLTLSATGGEGNQTFIVTAAENTATTARSTTIEVSGEGLSQTIQVTQSAAGIILIAAPTNISFVADGGTENVALDANDDWTVDNENNWFTVSPMSGNGSMDLTITATENPSTEPRMGTFTITSGGVTTTVTITQEGAAAILTVSPDNLQYESPGGTQAVSVTANIDWTAEASDDWFTVARTEGSGNSTFTVTATENPSTEPRSGTITFTGGGLTFVVQVNQSGAGSFLSTTPQNLAFTATENCSELNIQSNVDWSISTDIDWITSISPTEGNGSMAVTICYTANEGTENREGTLVISSDDLEDVVVNVVQSNSGFFITVNPQTIQVPATPGVASFELNSNTSWTISENMDWFSVSAESGDGNATIDVTYDQNFVTTDRQGMITVSIDGQEVTVLIIQAGAVPFINVQETEFNVDEFEGCIDLSIFANSGWTVTSDNDWITSIEPASGEGNGTVTICYAANPAGDPRGAEITVTADADVTPIIINVIQDGMTVGLEDVNGNDITVTTYPNPATEIINWQFSTPLSSDVSLEIISADGKLVENNTQALKKGIQSYQLATNRYAAGIYFYRLIGEEGATSGRFIVK